MRKITSDEARLIQIKHLLDNGAEYTLKVYGESQVWRGPANLDVSVIRIGANEYMLTTILYDGWRSGAPQGANRNDCAGTWEEIASELRTYEKSERRTNDN